MEFTNVESAKEAINQFHNSEMGDERKMYVQFARKNAPIFRKGGLRLGWRRDNENRNYSNQDRRRSDSYHNHGRQDRDRHEGHNRDNNTQHHQYQYQRNHNHNYQNFRFHQ